MAALDQREGREQGRGAGEEEDRLHAVPGAVRPSINALDEQDERTGDRERTDESKLRLSVVALLSGRSTGQSASAIRPRVRS